MDIEEIRKRNFELQQENKVLSETIANLTKPQTPPHIEVSGNDGHLVMDPALIDRGAVIVTLRKTEPLTPKDGEISRNDQQALNANLEAIAAGNLKVVG